MILGAGVYQVPYIKRAQAMGMETVVVSIPGDYPGIALADHYIELDTTDTEGVRKAAEEWEISAICTGGTDVCVPTLGHVAEALSLPAVSPEAAVTISTKSRFRHFLRDNHLPCPRFCCSQTFEPIMDELAAWDSSIVFKPDDSSGSRGVGILDTWNPVIAREHFEYAKCYSRSGMVCAESFLEGIEVGGDGFMWNSRLVFYAVTHKHMEGLLVRGHSLPTNITPDQERQVGTMIEQTCVALGYLNGPVNYDAMVNGEEVFVLEMGARSGGNGIVDLIELGTGVDLCTAVIEYAAGREVSLDSGKTRTGYGTVVFGSPVAGTLRGLADIDALRLRVPEVCRLQLAAPLGARVKPLIHNANLLGYVVFKCALPQEYDRISKAVLSALDLKVESSGST
jgi:biotin carboxylase